MNTKAKDMDSGGLIIILMATQMVCFLLTTQMAVKMLNSYRV